MSIRTQMKEYPYKTLDSSRDAYGQLKPSSSTPIGTIKMSINLVSQATNSYILYSGADYIGLTTDEVNDTYIIEFGNEDLKVKYVNPIGKLKQVALVKIV